MNFCRNFANAGLIEVPPSRRDMGSLVKDSADEIKRLQRCISDLLSLLPLPAIWSGNQPSQIVPIMLDTLLVDPRRTQQRALNVPVLLGG